MTMGPGRWDAIKSVKYAVKWPYRALRRAGISRRLASLPGNRGWRTDIPPTLHISIVSGVLDYRYRDVPMQKHPVEIALYMRLIWELKPRTVIEIGSGAGGSAAWIGDTLKTFGVDGKVISIDLTPPGATLTPTLIATLPRQWLVIEDASHHYGPTLTVLRFFDPLLSSGEYIVVEDANMTEMGTDAGYRGGRARAICEFLAERSADYELDEHYCDQYGFNVTGNPNGYLRRK